MNEGCIDNYYDAKTGILNVGGLEKEGSKIEREKTSKFVRQRNTAVYEAAISPAVCINLKRAKDKRVFQEKYRLVFTTEFNNEKYWVGNLKLLLSYEKSLAVLNLPFPSDI